MTRPSDAPSLDALIFDVGGVIVPHDNDLLHRRLAAACAAPDAYRRLHAGAAHDHRYATGAASIADLHRALVDELGYGRSYDQFLDDWCCHLGLDQAMLSLVEALASRARVLLFSNTNREHWDYLLALSGGPLGAFEAYLSHEIGAAKPDPSAYRLVADRARIDPRRALFVDDRADNVAAADGIGFHTLVFKDQSGLIARLEAFGLSPRA